MSHAIKKDELSSLPSTPITDIEFSKACMTTSEAYLVLQKRTKAFNQPDHYSAGREQPIIQRNALKYCESFAKYRTPESTEAIRRALESAGLNPGQVAMMASLCPGDVDTARSLIPGLKDFSDTEIKKMIVDIEKFTSS